MESDDGTSSYEDEGIEDDSDSNSNMEDETNRVNGTPATFLPGDHLNPNEELVCDDSAYTVLHKARTGAPCLSFDIIPDNLGNDRADSFPMTVYAVAGTQSERTHVNSVVVMKMSNMNRTKRRDGEEDSADDSSEDEDDKAELECALVRHQGCVNRIRMVHLGERPVAASWSELKRVYIWDLSRPLEVVNDPHQMGAYVRNGESPPPIFTFSGHQAEGFAMDWSTATKGVLATGDCLKHIHIWKPVEGGTWHVDQRSYTAHTASVEDLQWSPNEANVLASCSVDKSIRIWDTRAAPNKACMLTKNDAHERDVNVIAWNRREPFLLSGGDDGVIRVWDLRSSFQSGEAVATFKHHTAPITSVEWHPTDSTVFAASGADDQITLWDLAVEHDPDVATEDDAKLSKLPPQLLFIHQGQSDIKELHWHPQTPGLIVSTAQSGFNVFRTISV